MTDAPHARPDGRALVTAVPANGPGPLAFLADMAPPELERLRSMLAALADLGHLATFSITSDPAAPLGFGAAVAVLRERLGPELVDAVAEARRLSAPEPAPDLLAPVWGFDRVNPAGDILIGTLRLLGADLEIVGFRVVRDGAVSPASTAAGEFARWAPLLPSEPGTVSVPGHAGEYVLVARALPVGAER